MHVKGPAALPGRQLYKPGVLALLLALPALASAPGCATVRVYRPVPAGRAAPVPQTAAPTIAPEPESKPALEQGRIKEESLEEKRPAPQARSKDRPGRPAPVEGRMAPRKEAPAPLPDDGSLIAKITPRTPPQRAASLRLTEEGRKFIESGDYAKALGRLEKTISIDSTNPYGYYYLAQTHFRLGRHQDSLNFLDVAESLLGN
ncbi:MAG: tetratricopeptide repeat protein, partial [Deltaproteobacteria bacterium]|nr:tetratricopeptide repeat protein [Deltaproteobacteria bacterium]